jgi:hypothetical protein
MTKENMNKLKHLKRLKFNSYGDNFLMSDDVGNLFIFSLMKKLPKIILWNTNTKSCKDATFLNNSGVIATTYNKNNPHTTLWDFLLPINHSNVGELHIGGNLMTSTVQGLLLICNDKPGFVSFIDLRKLEVAYSFQAHLDEIKGIKISERENFIVTIGKGIII